MEAEIHAKLTGAGKGGCVICFPKDPDFSDSFMRVELFKAFETKGYQIYDKIKQSSEGLKYKISASISSKH